ncbi:MAG: dihydrodipicolinate synthase family protein [Bacillota bacterium]
MVSFSKNKRLIFATVTPFSADGEIDYSAFEEYLSFLETLGTKTILINGTTGEFPSLTSIERISILEFCRKHFSGTIINNISSTSIKECIELLRHSFEYADAAIVLPPFYYANVTIEGVKEFFRKILDLSRIPLYLYNFPKHTKFNITQQLIKELLNESPNLAGIKDSSSDLLVAHSYKSLSPELQVLVGKDTAVMDILESDLDGSITGAGNPVPEFLIGIYRTFCDGNVNVSSTIKEMFDVWNNMRKTLDIAEIPLVKLTLSARITRFPTHVRKPLVQAGDDQAEIIRSLFRTHILPLCNKAFKYYS